MLSNRKILPMDYELILKWYQKYLNSGEYIDEILSHDLANPEYLGFILENNKECVGIISAKPNVSFTYPKIQLEQEIVDYVGGRRIFTLDLIVVEEKFRGQHLSSVLGKLLIDALKNIGVELLLVEFWVMPDGNIPADGFLRKFTKQIYSKIIPMFYEELSHYNMTCPVCGNHCICGAEVLVLEFN